MKVKEITTYLESQFPLGLQEEYDNCGLQIGNPDQNIDRILVCIDVTDDIIDEAISRGCQLIISHHPLIFKGLKKIIGSNMVERVVHKAILNDLSIYAVHTNIDNYWQGVNAIICEKIGLADFKILKPKELLLRKIVTFCPDTHADDVRKALFDAGAGQIGNYDQCSFNSLGQGTFRALENANPFVGSVNEMHLVNEVRIEAIYPVYLESRILRAMIEAHPYEEVAYDILLLGNKDKYCGSGMIGSLTDPMQAKYFLLRLKEIFRIPCVRFSGDLSIEIRKVAVCGGAGAFLLNDALSAGADAFLTGDIKYHDFFIPEGRMILADIGHYESEQFTKDVIVKKLNRKFPTFAALKTEIVTNPVNYL